jgi:hypothetical protein
MTDLDTLERDLRDAFCRRADATTIGEPPEAPRTTVARPQRRRWAVPLVAAAAVLAIAAAAVGVSTQRHERAADLQTESGDRGYTRVDGTSVRVPDPGPAFGDPKQSELADRVQLLRFSVGEPPDSTRHITVAVRDDGGRPAALADLTTPDGIDTAARSMRVLPVTVTVVSAGPYLVLRVPRASRTRGQYYNSYAFRSLDGDWAVQVSAPADSEAETLDLIGRIRS